MTYAPWSVDAASAVLATTCDKPGPILISLQALQEEFGYVHEQDVELVAKACNVSRADVHGVLTYYHDLRTSPPAATTLRICVAEACQAVGCRDLVDEVEKVFNARMDEAGEDVELKSVYCLGNCALGPSAMVNGVLMGRASAQGLKDAAQMQVKS
ncbi:MAG TPA: NAD(P)H-dependent oxidoreductase subunit E [Candidatus Nanopelagicaceae bacterium]|jgi:formate dehydrogenase subunit gamma